MLKLQNLSYMQRYNAMIKTSQHVSLQGTCEWTRRRGQTQHIEVTLTKGALWEISQGCRRNKGKRLNLNFIQLIAVQLSANSCTAVS